MTEETPWAGTFCKKADMAVLQALEDKDLLFDAPLFEHSYPHCWRCDTPLIYYARETWFIRMTAVKEDLIRNNNTINWIRKASERTLWRLAGKRSGLGTFQKPLLGNSASGMAV